MTPVPTKSVRTIIDASSGGKLTESLVRWRAEGVTVPAMVQRLYDEQHVDVKERTVFRWLSEIEGAS